LTERASCVLGPRWVCVNCGDLCPRKRPPPWCNQCGMVDAYAPEEVELSAILPDQIEDLTPGVIVPEWAPLLPRGLCLGCSLVMRARPGAGKSRSAFRLAGALGGRAMVFALEMGAKLSADTARDAGADTSQFYWYEDADKFEEVEALDPVVVVVDSIQKLPRRKAWIARARQWARDRDRNLILISQKGKHGASRHGEDDDFDCDCIVDVMPCEAEGRPRSELHHGDERPTACAPGCAHAVVVKSRICMPGAWDVPIGAGVAPRVIPA